jgi:cytochrome c biogenesis protein CcmG/thiol:disulfide interchange protein DsbE
MRVALCLLVIAACHSQPAPSNSGRPTAAQLVDRMIAAYQKAKTYSDHGQISVVTVEDGKRITTLRTFETLYQRPNKFRYDVRDNNAKEPTSLWSFDHAVLTGHIAAHFLQAGASVKLLDVEPAFAEAIDGHPCWRIGSPDLTLWIDQKTFLLRKTTGEGHTATYEPVIDGPVSEARLVAPKQPTPSWVGVRVDEKPVRITQVIKGAPGDKAGLKIGDEILSVDTAPIPSGPAFVQRVMRTKNGDTLSIEIVRGGGKITLKVPVEERPQSIANSALIDKAAPLFAATKLSGGGSTTLADLRGHVVIVDFWATWCGPCAITIPRLKQLHDKLGPKGLRIVGLSSEEPDLIKKFVADKSINYDIGLDADDKISSEYLREGIPMFVVIDKQGIVRHVITGANMDAVEEVLPALL